MRTDGVLFHVTLLLSGLDLERLQHQKYGRCAKELLKECISLLNKRIQDYVFGLSDQATVTVANLAAIEVNYLPIHKIETMEVLLRMWKHERGSMRALQMHTAVR